MGTLGTVLFRDFELDGEHAGKPWRAEQEARRGVRVAVLDDGRVHVTLENCLGWAIGSSVVEPDVAEAVAGWLLAAARAGRELREQSERPTRPDLEPPPNDKEKPR